MFELISLFAVSFLAATIFPAQSEAVLAALQYGGKHNELTLLFVATAGNVLGALVNWVLGRYLIQFRERSWFPIKGKALYKATNFYQKWGVWSLLLAWMPLIGDAFTLVAGIFKTNIWLFLLLVTLGKMGRYATIILIM